MKQRLAFIGVTIALVLLVLYASRTGSVQMPLGQFLQAIWTQDPAMEAIRDLRFPRIIIALFVGAALSVSGALLQAIMRNPLADAGIIGISSGAAFVQLAIISFFPMYFFLTPVYAFLGGAFACFLVFALSWRSGLRPLKLILVGIAINAMFTGLTEALLRFGGSFNTSAMSVVGSNLTMRTWSDVQLMVGYGGVGLFIAFFLAKWCNVLVLQDQTTKSVGFPVMKARIIIASVAVLLAASSVVAAGIIAFVGLLVPHIGRRLVGSNYQRLLPFSALLGAFLVLLADTVGRTILAPIEIPASTLFAVIGGPFLLVLLRKE